MSPSKTVIILSTYRPQKPFNATTRGDGRLRRRQVTLLVTPQIQGDNHLSVNSWLKRAIPPPGNIEALGLSSGGPSDLPLMCLVVVVNCREQHK